MTDEGSLEVFKKRPCMAKIWPNSSMSEKKRHKINTETFSKRD